MNTEVHDDVFPAVRRCIAESLAVEPDRIGLQARLVDDLGADSLDFVDIIFMLDSELGIRVRDTELTFLTRLDFSSPEVMQAEHLTEAVVSRLEKWLPAVAAAPDRTAISPAQLFSMITVEAICLVVTRALDERESHAEQGEQQ